MSNLGMPGGWSPFSCDITKEARAAFNEAVEGASGPQYSPVAVAQQVVAGMNYAFFCNVASVDQEPAAMVNIYKPLPGRGSSEITSITEIKR